MSIDYLTAWTTQHYDRYDNGDPILQPPAGLLIHDSGGTQSSDLPWLCITSDPPVSCTIYINRSGQVFKLAEDRVRTWHAGAADGSQWYGHPASSFGILDPNRLIGIELEHLRGTSYTDPQLASLAAVCQEKVRAYNFQRERVGLHRWIAPSRKTDPDDLNDQYWHQFIDSLYDTAGAYYRVTAQAGAHVRQGPGTTFLIAASIPAGTVFYSSNTLAGQSIDGNAEWVHYSGPTPYHPSPLGFVWSGIVELVPFTAGGD